METCPTCKGKTKCVVCSGTGHAPQPAPDLPRPAGVPESACPTCLGTGTCQVCHGTGVVENLFEPASRG